ncbi:MAG: tail fiber domain-containing protein [Candidatus Omnitrophota bacterium]|nr:MAG: tail fiber domain-containing protein [Candidatus Omnitrophota bacterium]
MTAQVKLIRNLFLIAIAALVIIFVSPLGVIGEEVIVLTTIVPNQDTLRVERGAIGTSYRQTSTLSDEDIGDNNLLIEGNVGIGTTELGTILTIRKPDIPGGGALTPILRIAQTTLYGAGRSGLEFYSENLNYPMAAIGAQPGVGWTNPAFHLQVANIGRALKERITIKASGNVGIGSEYAADVLDIRGGEGTLSIREAIEEPHKFLIDQNDTVGTDLSENWGELTFSTPSSDGANDRIERMRIETGDSNGDGNIGIGTTNPDEILSITATEPSIKLTDLGVYTWRMKADGQRLNFLHGSVGQYQTMTLYLDNVGIGTTNPGYELDVAGQCHATSHPTSSDIRFKKNIIRLTNVLEKLENIRGVSFEWNAKYERMGRSTGHKEIGVIAQEIESVFPELVTTWEEQNYRAIEYGRFTGVLVEAIKELKAEKDAEIEQLKLEIAALKAKL